MQFDETLKQQLQATHLRLLGQLAGAPVRRWLNVELPRTQMRRVDLLAELETGVLFHLELQTRNDTKIGQRLLDYCLRIEEQLQQVPNQMVLYVGWEPLRMSPTLEWPHLRFEYSLLDIRDLDAEMLRSGGRIEDLILMVLCGNIDPKQAALEVLREIGLLPHPERGDALANLLVTSGLRRLHDDLREEMRHMPLLDDLLENPFLQDWFKEGEAKGVAQGVARGRSEEAVRMLTHILEHRFGPLPEPVKERIRSTPTEKLEAAVGHVLEAQTLDQALTGF